MKTVPAVNAKQDELPRFEGCDVVERLRTGLVADVYHAIQQPLGRRVLIKALSSSILPSSPFAATLELEARLLAQMDHPNILVLHDFVQEKDRLWLVLEYVDGVLLTELLEKSHPLSPAAAVAIALEVARALAHVHECGVVHRDVQPDNILIARTGAVKLINFAVALNDKRPSSYDLLDVPSSFSKPSYMSPERLLGEATDARSDLFSLGVVLYEMLSGRLPFEAQDEKSTSQRIRHEPVTPVSRLAHDTTGPLERAVHRCLEKLPSDRFASASELVTTLEGVLKQFSATSTRFPIGEALFAAGLSDRRPKRLEPSPPRLGSAAHMPLWPVLRGHVIGLFLIVVGGGLIQALSSEQDTAPARGSQRLELVPSQLAHLRVVADPWARVSVDGQYVDTTPFAWAIPLRAGTHYVRLEHPAAPIERRTIELVPGESVLLDVEMKVVRPPIAPGPRSAPSTPPSGPQADAGTADSSP